MHSIKNINKKYVICDRKNKKYVIFQHYSSR